MVPGHYNQTRVRRLRVKGRRLDSLAAQLRLDNLLQTVEMHPSRLPSSAIVCVRRLHDPMPRAINLHSRRATQSSAWQQAVSALVQEEIGRAIHPLNADVSPDVNAVIFRDQAELLACLAMDWMEDRVRERWWWRSLGKDQFFGNVMPDVWSDAPQYVPAALELLAVNQRLEPFVRALSVDRTRTLLREITRSFGLAKLHAVLEDGLGQIACEASDEKSSSLQFEAAAVAPSQPAPPWRRLVPESLDDSLGIERQCLIGVALTIRRVPAAAQSHHFARATMEWLRAAATTRIVDVTEAYGTSTQSHDDHNLASIPSTMHGDVVRESFSSEQIHFVPDVAEPAAANQRRSRVYETPAPSLSSLGIRLNHETEEAIASGLSNSIASPGVKKSSDTFFAEAAVETAPDLLPLDEVRLETQFGGVFYLINLALFLELYADFTTPLGKSLELSIFNFIDLIARRLLNEKITEDPLWTLLAQLSGRSEFDRPGDEFEPPGEWRLPSQWLAAFPGEANFEWLTEGERLCIRHPAGFLLLDVPLSGRLEEQLKREMVVYTAGAEPQLVRKSFSLSRSNNSLEQWLDWIVPYLRARLCRAFGIDDESDSATLLCRQRASISLTAVHLDIFFSLSEHPLEIRSAGLDRDPGWVPAAGRFIRFHFE
jgi:hypothetical protein